MRRERAVPLPASRTSTATRFIREGQLMVEAARKYNRLVQIGTQSRSARSAIDTIRFLQRGGLGKIEYVVAFANKPRTSIGLRSTALPIGEDVDYDLWCGPADEVPTFRGYPTDVCAHCEGGYAMVRAGHVLDHQGQRIRTFSGGEDIFENFIRAVRSRRQEDLDAELPAAGDGDHLRSTARARPRGRQGTSRPGSRRYRRTITDPY